MCFLCLHDLFSVLRLYLPAAIFQEDLAAKRIPKALTAKQVKEEDRDINCVLNGIDMSVDFGEDEEDDNHIIKIGSKVFTDRSAAHIPLKGHPFIANRFVMNPPTVELKVDDGSALEYEALLELALITGTSKLKAPKPATIRNPGGVTVGDLCNWFAKQ